MVDPVKLFHTPSLITMQNLVAVSHAVCVHVSAPKNVGNTGAPPLEIGVWLTPRNTLLPHVCYHTKFGRATSNL